MQIAAAAFARVQRGYREGLAVAVQTHDRLEYRPLVPAREQLPEFGIEYVALHKAAYIRVPPRYARQTDVQPGLQLVAQRLPCGWHVSAPQYVSVFLAARPAAAQQVQRAALAKRLDRLEIRARVELRVNVAALQRGADVIAEIVEIVFGKIRLGVVQPEEIYAVIVIALFAFFPYVSAGLRVGGVYLHAVALKVVRLHRAALRAHQKPLLSHLPEVFAAPVHARPYGHHHLYAHGVQLVRHRFGVRPVGLVEFPVALQRPVEKVDNYHVKLYAQRLIPARD